MNRYWGDVHEPLHFAVLLPSPEKQNKGLRDIKLAERVSQPDGRLISGRLGIHRKSPISKVSVPRNIPFLSIALRLISVEKLHSNPLLKHHPILLNLLRRQPHRQQHYP